MNYLITHSKGPQGWSEARIAPVSSKRLSPFEREWLDWMLANGSTVVTIGDTMLEIKTPQEVND
jgi:hypothetical protein